MASPNSPTSPTSSAWSDRRGLTQRGKELHDPANPMEVFARRRLSSSASAEGSGADMSKVMSNESVKSNGSNGERRASNSAGMFGNLLQHKRGSQDYSARRASVEEMEGKPAGWFNSTFNSTFRGIQKSPAEQQQGMKKAEEARRGVME